MSSSPACTEMQRTESLGCLPALAMAWCVRRCWVAEAALLRPESFERGRFHFGSAVSLDKRRSGPWGKRKVVVLGIDGSRFPARL